MKDLVKKQVEEIKAVNPEVGVINAVVMPNEGGSQLAVVISANADDVAKVIDSIFENYPQVREALVAIAMAKSMAIMMQHHNEESETSSEEFTEVN